MSTPDQLRVAELHGQALHCVYRHVPAAEAIESLREITRRPDLLAHAAGVIIGSSDRELGDWSMNREAARLLIAAGADRRLLPEWVEQGRWNVRRAVFTRAEWPDDTAELLAEVLEGVDPEL